MGALKTTLSTGIPRNPFFLTVHVVSADWSFANLTVFAKKHPLFSTPAILINVNDISLYHCSFQANQIHIVLLATRNNRNLLKTPVLLEFQVEISYSIEVR